MPQPAKQMLSMAKRYHIDRASLRNRQGEIQQKIGKWRFQSKILESM
jgi:hypothetical protein